MHHEEVTSHTQGCPEKVEKMRPLIDVDMIILGLGFGLWVWVLGFGLWAYRGYRGLRV